ncbi:MAG: hypothetical protein K6T73_01325 [Candidatus Bathyarchaeota archaeon]|nr:hypothetical protein [Candidatus Bathyarchaeota archaeon]
MKKNNQVNPKRMELVECINKMWDTFVLLTTDEERESIESFLAAKERAHQIISEISQDREE